MLFVHPTALEIKRSSVTASGEFEGYGATFGDLDCYQDIIAAGAFAKSLQTHAAEGSRPKMLWSHDPSEPIGSWLDMREDSRGLAVHGRLELGIPRAAAAHALMQRGELALSIGFMIPEGGAKYDGNGVRHIKEVDLWEVSPVVFPANRRAKITAVKSAITDIRGFEAAVRDVLGFSAREAKRIASGGWKALSNEQTTTTELDALLGSLRAAALKLSEKPNHGSSRDQRRDR